MTRTHLIAAAIGALLAAGMGTTAHAQQQPSYSDADIRTYAEAVAEVREINQKYTPKMQAAETQQEQQAVRQEATDEMIEAIEETGLTLQKYSRIAEASNNDPELARKIQNYMQ